MCCQIGDPEDRRKIYIEDYVITYLLRLAGEETLNSRVAILLGHSERMDGLPYLFIRGAVGLKNLEYTEAGIPFTDETWAEVYGAMKEYFADLDILGWYLSLPGYPMELGSELLKIHVNYFGGVDKVLMVSDSAEVEADFFAYENGRLTRQRGYAIFYERNEAMQRYMIETGDGESIDEKEHFEDPGHQELSDHRAGEKGAVRPEAGLDLPVHGQHLFGDGSAGHRDYSYQ